MPRTPTALGLAALAVLTAARADEAPRPPRPLKVVGTRLVNDRNERVWLNGGKVTERNRRTGTELAFEAVGLQALLDAVRETGAANVVIAGGLNWAYDLSGVVAGRRLADPKGRGVVYANHAYPNKGDT